MRALLQRVNNASVSVDQHCIARINCGLLVFIGFCHSDTHQQSKEIIDKIIHLRVFEDDQGKMNRSVQEYGGEILLVSQFTLYGDCKKGRRPSFKEAMAPDIAKSFYDEFVDLFSNAYACSRIQTGQFGADMCVSLENAGPVTLLIEK